ncbi:hypothetical protein [Actinomadura sp. 3N407]|uniref:AraC-like ligand-binding domain-containing protein n=1 Tax=Actinomadura sp. 3N407 TaxID=3457423 RepID=UPI003FCCBB8B
MRIKPDRDRPFTGAFRGTRIGDVCIARVRSAPCTIVRPAGLIRSTDREMLKLVFLDAGRIGIEQAGRQSLLKPGDMVGYETVRPYARELRCLNTAESVIVAVPTLIAGRTRQPHVPPHRGSRPDRHVAARSHRRLPARPRRRGRTLERQRRPVPGRRARITRDRPAHQRPAARRA